MGPSRSRVLCGAIALAVWLLSGRDSGVHAAAGEAQRSILLLPIASGTPGQEWSAKALGGIFEDGFGSLRGVRLVSGAAREGALRELAASATVTQEAFLEICRRAGADLAVLGGSTLAGGRLALEVRIFDAGAARELRTYDGDEPVGRAFGLVAAAIRHVAAEAGLDSGEPRFPRGVTTSLEAYAAYRAALLEEAPAARIEKLRLVLNLDADYMEATLRLGVELFRQESIDEALRVLERAVVLGPKVAEARNNYGVALAAAGRPEPAQREFEEAVALAADYAEARLNLARVLEDRGRFSEAEKQYAAVLEANAGNDKARFGLAVLYDRTGRPEQAIKEFRLLSSRRPDLAEAEFIKAGQEARKARDYARAEKYFLRATDVNPQLAQAWAELGTNSYLAEDYPKGMEYFRKALAIDPGQAAYHYYLGLALDKGRQREEALKEYRRAVELGGPAEARLGLARAALESGDASHAVEELNRLLAVNPENAEAKTLLAQATAEMESRRRLLEGQSQFANQRLARLEQIVADTTRANRELEARLQSVTQEKRSLEEQARGERGSVPGGAAGTPPASAVSPEAPVPPVVAPGRRADGASSQEGAAVVRARTGELDSTTERLQGELSAERDARRREGAEASAALTLLRAEKERLQADLAAAQATARELGRGSGEAEELRRRLAGLQADQARAQTESSQEREARRLETERLNAALAASEAARDELARKVNEAAEFKGRLLAAEDGISRAEQERRAERDRGERALAAERDARRAEVEQLRADVEAGRFTRQEKDRVLQDLAAEKARAAAALAAREKAERTAAVEREARVAEIDKLKADLAATQVRKQDLERLTQDLAAEKAHARTERAAREKAEQALLAEKEQAAKAMAAERAGRQSEVESVKADLAATQVRRQDLERLAKDLAAEQGRARAEQTSREKAEQALADLRAGSERAIAAERERGAQALAGEREERRRESEVQLAKGRADVALLVERLTALEARAAAETRALAERERVLEKMRQGVRDLALELGRIALRTQSWEKARGYLEQAADADPKSGEAWYGLGEAYFQLGQYEKSKQMYQKAREIY